MWFFQWVRSHQISGWSSSSLTPFFSVHVRLPATAGGIFEEVLCATNGGEFGAGIFSMERGNAVRFSGRFFSGERPLSF